MGDKQCKALKHNKQRCSRTAQGSSNFCWQHRFSRFGEASWYNDTTIQLVIALAGLVFAIYSVFLGVSGAKQKDMSNQNKLLKTAIEEYHRQDQENHQQTREVIKQYSQGIPEDLKLAVANVFMDVLKLVDIPQSQWAEKLQEIAKSHQKLLDEKLVLSGDQAVNKLKYRAKRMIESGDYVNADQLYQEAIELEGKTIKFHQENLDKHNLSKAQSLSSRARIAKIRLSYNKAIEFYKEALDVLPAFEETLHVEYLNNLGLLYNTLGKYDQAEVMLDFALSIAEANFGKDHQDVAIVLNNLAMFFMDVNRLPEAEDMLERSVEILGNYGGVLFLDQTWALNNLASLYAKTNRLDDAEKLLKRALAIAEANYVKSPSEVTTLLSNLSGVYAKMNRLSEAEEMLDRSVEIFENYGGKQSANYPKVLNNLASLYTKTNHLDNAEKLLKRALASDEARLGKGHPDVAIELSNLAAIYTITNRLEDAEKLRKRAVEIYHQLNLELDFMHEHFQTEGNLYFNLLLKMGYSKGDARAKLKQLAPELFKKNNMRLKIEMGIVMFILVVLYIRRHKQDRYDLEDALN